MVRNLMGHGSLPGSTTPSELHSTAQIESIQPWLWHGLHTRGSRQAIAGSFLGSVNTGFADEDIVETRVVKGKTSEVQDDIDTGLLGGLGEKWKGDNGVVPPWKKQWRHAEFVRDAELEKVRRKEERAEERALERKEEREAVRKSTEEAASSGNGVGDEAAAKKKEGGGVKADEGSKAASKKDSDPKAIAKKSGNPLASAAKDSNATEETDYCCTPLSHAVSGGKVPCGGFGVTRHCMADQLKNAPFDEETHKTAEVFRKSEADWYCCKREKCVLGGRSKNIKVKMAEVQEAEEPGVVSTAKAGTEDLRPISTADIIENSRRCNFMENPEYHGCRPQEAMDPLPSSIKPAGSNYKNCMEYEEPPEEKLAIDEYYSG